MVAVEAELTKDEAIEHLRRASWAPMVDTCGHNGCEDHVGASPRRRIHSLLGGIGADHNLEDAEERIRTAEFVGWVRHLLRHDLYVRTPEGRQYYYDVPRPKENADA